MRPTEMPIRASLPHNMPHSGVCLSGVPSRHVEVSAADSPFQANGQTILRAIPPTYDTPLNCTHGRDARIRTGGLLLPKQAR